MARLAWFTPFAPVRSGIAAYSAELLPLLGARHRIDVFTSANPSRPETSGERGGAGNEAVAGLQFFGAHDFLWKHGRSPYDLVVYQLGNAACHDFMWPHLAAFPGLLVLHDGQLHHERSRALLTRGRLDDYRAEFRHNHPEAPPDLAELFISALGGSLYYLYPMRRWVVRTARLVAVHSRGLAADLAETDPGVEVRRIRHGMIDPVTPDSLRAAASIRQRHGIPEGKTLFAAFGLVTPEKRISAALRALAAVTAAGNDVYLLVAGGTTPHWDAEAEARALGVADRVRITGYVADEDLRAYVLAADVCLCLRWPTSRETSGTWIRAVAAGRPTVITDLAHTADVPSLDPRTWLPVGMASTEARPTTEPDRPALRPKPPAFDSAFAPVAVAIDLLDEVESLRAAMARLSVDAGLREMLGRNGREHWRAHHTMACAVDDYEAAIERALARPVPHVRDLPAHLRPDPEEHTRRLAAAFGVEMADIWPPPPGERR